MMSDLVPALVVAPMVVAVTVGAVLAFFGALHFTRSSPHGFMHLYFYAAFGALAASNFLSSRDFTLALGSALDAAPRSGVATWVVRLCTLVMMFISSEQLLRVALGRERVPPERLVLLSAYVVFWVATVAFPTFVAPHGAPFQSNWLYPLFVVAGFTLSSQQSAERSIGACRNAIFIFCVVSFLATLVKPGTTLQTNYTQGYIPGLPRFAGLAPHPILMGLISCVGVWCVILRPYKRRWLNNLGWAIFLSALFVAQAKANWIALLISAPILAWYRYRAWVACLPKPARKRAAEHGDVAIGVGALVVVALLAIAAGGGLSNSLSFLSSQETEQLSSFTGRDRIWAVAISEWMRYPVFGYGMDLFSASYQASVGMLGWATSGHSQYFDVLGRSGSVGMVATVLLMGALVYFSISRGHQSKGIAVAIAVTLIVRSISEICIIGTSVDADMLPIFLLLVLIAASPKTAVKVSGASGAKVNVAD
jgi:O-antigen ligase